MTEGITWWAIVSAFGGAIIGGLISYFLQKLNLKAAGKQRENARREIREAIAYSLFFKMITIVSRLHHIRSSIREMLKAAEVKGFKGPLWSVLIPIVPIPEPVHFQSEEMSLVLSLDDGAFNDIVSFDEIHNSTVAVLALYNSKRNAILERFGAEMKGNVGTTELGPEDIKWLAPRAVELNEIAASIVDRIECDAEKVAESLRKLHDALEKGLKLNKRIEFVGR